MAYDGRRLPVKHKFRSVAWVNLRVGSQLVDRIFLSRASYTS